MNDPINNIISLPQQKYDLLNEVLREGAIQLLNQAIRAEVASYIDAHKEEKDEHGHRLVTRNGYLPPRQIQTGLGSLTVEQPRVNDRREGARFHSAILPPYLRRTKNIEELLPWLYLKGISTGDFSEALSSLLGINAAGLSASTIVRLKSSWQDEYEVWNKRTLKNQRYAYIWADGVHFNIRLGADGGDANRTCILVVIGATFDGSKELIAVKSGQRESTLSWKELLLELRDRGLTQDPQLAIADGALGFWSALAEIYPSTKRQRCWVHKTVNLLDKLPKSKQFEAKQMIHSMYMSETKIEAEKSYSRFIELYEAKYPRATDCLKKDVDDLFTFYSFPAEHWSHIRSTNPIESTFATVRLRTYRTKGCGSEQATLSMVFKLAQSASRKWRKLNGAKLLADLIDARIYFQDGLRMELAA